MRAFIRLFFTLFIPVTLLIAVVLTLYFTVQYSFSQAMSLGVLYGLFSGIIVTMILTIALLSLGGGKLNMQNIFKKTPKEKESTDNDSKQHEELTDDKAPINQNVTKDVQQNNTNLTKGIDQKMMLLMNKELTFEIILSTIKNQFSRSLTTHNSEKGNIDIKIQDETIAIAVTPLTKHTSQVIINGTNNSKYIQDIVSFLKEKEHSFLQY